MKGMDEGYRAPSEESSGALGARNYNGREGVKRASKMEVMAQLTKIMSILPHDARKNMMQEAGTIYENPGAAMDLIRKEIEKNRERIGMLNNDLSIEEALREIDILERKLTGGSETIH